MSIRPSSTTPRGSDRQAITLSYTFHETDLPEAQAALDTTTAAPRAASN
jgi:hypothetical protein